MTAATAESTTIEQQALTTIEKANLVVVTNLEQRSFAAEIGRGVAALYKEAEEFFAPMKKAAAAAHKEVCNKENSVLKPLEEAKRRLSGLIGNFDAQMERERLAEEARQQQEARRIAEAEAKRIAEEQAIQDAIALSEAGDTKGAEAVLSNPTPVAVYVPPVIIPKQVPKAAGVTASKIWKFRITNEADIPREYLMVDETKIGQIVRALKDKTNIPGIQAYGEDGARFRA